MFQFFRQMLIAADHGSQFHQQVVSLDTGHIGVGEKINKFIGIIGLYNIIVDLAEQPHPVGIGNEIRPVNIDPGWHAQDTRKCA